MTQLDTKLFNEKGEEPFKKLDSAAKINIELGFVLQNNEIEVNVSFSTPIKNNTLFEKSQLLYTKSGWISIQGKVKKIDFVEQSTKKLMEVQVNR